MSPTALLSEWTRLQVMDEYDKNHQGQIDFGDFLRMFRHKLLDLQEIMKYMSMKSAREQEQQQQATAPPQASTPIRPFSRTKPTSFTHGAKLAGDGFSRIMLYVAVESSNR